VRIVLPIIRVLSICINRADQYSQTMITDIDSWFAALDRFADIPFMEDGRRQPAMPEPRGPLGQAICPPRNPSPRG
jgi:hypothetical protein